jgi:hypothetical protein
MMRPRDRDILYRLLFSGDGFIADLRITLMATAIAVLVLFLLALFF